MNVVDWILLGALALFALVGWHRGFISGLMSFLGFLGGGLVAALVLPRLLDSSTMSTFARAAVIGIGILVACFAGQFVASYFGDRLRDAIRWTPARTVDRVGGVVLNVLVLAVLTWMVITIASYLPTTSVTEQMTRSKVAVALDALVPDQAQGVFDGIQSVLSTTSVTTLFSGLAGLSGPEVDAPEQASVTSAVLRSGRSVVQVSGYADRCDTNVSGSGFVVARHLVMTNAHVVAGLEQAQVTDESILSSLPATVVYFDPEADIAVLSVPDLDLPALDLAREAAESGDPAVVAGYPHSGPFTISPVRVRTKVDARTQDIYGDASATRSVYIVRGGIQKGDSGGPMLRPDGRVLGMAFGSDPDELSIGYVIANEDLTDVVDSVDSNDEAVDTGSCRIRE